MKKSLSLRGKITLFFAIISALLMLFLAGVAFYAFNSLTMETGRTHLLSIAEAVRLHLTETMLDNTISNRQRYFHRLETTNRLLSVRVVRSDTINKEFNTTSPEVVLSQAETEVLRDGKTIFTREVVNGQPTMRAIVPYVATQGTTTSPDCLQCHRTAKHGEVLGAVDITISTEDVESTSQRIVLVIVGSILFFIFAAVGAIFLWLSPITRLSQEIQTAVGKAVSGDFDSTITGAGSDELGTIARYLNTLFSVLHEGLSQMCNQIVHLTYLSNKTESPNLLQDTMEKVNGLVEMYDFKQTIEDDPTSLDVYKRLIHVIKERFHITEGAIYEINSRRTRLSYIPFNEDDEENMLCAPRILNTPENCRLFRTKRGVDSVKRPGVCTVFAQFVDKNEPPTKCHLCLPITTSSGIAACVQLVSSVESARQTRKNARFINIYLKELAPVLESKRLFEDLRRTSLHDPLTGLKNRRFLEEYTETITANLLRKNQYLTILMLDLDHFKAVNDTYGHDAGDIVLRHLAKTIKKILRASDLVIRMGGEEFLVLLLDTPIENGLRVAENIRKTLERSTITINDKVSLQKTVSIGAAEFPNAENDFWLAVKQSDAALYEAKESGRNRVVRYTHNPDDFDVMSSALSNPPSLFPT